MLSIILLGGCARTDQSEKPQDISSQEAGESSASEDTDIPASVTFQAQTIDGTNVSSDLFADSRLTMVNVWATYCNPCLNEMPGLGELASSYDTGDFQLIGIISDVPEDANEETLKYASDLITQTGADYPHLLLNESLYTALLTDVTAVPTTFFLDQEGTVLDTVIGAMDQSSWEEKINALLE